MYPKEYQTSLELVERNRRINIVSQGYDLNEIEKITLLQAYHPDYNESGFRRLKIGANKRTLVPVELARLLEAKSVISVGDVDVSVPSYDVDVLVIGGGGAGAVSALEAEKCGVNVMLVTKLRFGDSNTIMAEGGIQAAIKDNDSRMLHFIDSYGGGHFYAKRDLLSTMVSNASEAIKLLCDLGVEFDRDSDGTYITTRGGGMSRKRMHSVKDHIGLEIMQMLRDEVLNKSVRILEYTSAVELILDNMGNAAGAVLMDMENGTYKVVRAKTVIIATGGAGRLHFQGFQTSNHYGATADGLVLAYRVGAQLIFPDSFQYHPTGAAYPSQFQGALVTEKARSLGAKLVNFSGNVFCDSLESRDVVSAAIIRECKQYADGFSDQLVKAVWLDIPMVDQIHGTGTIEKRLPAIFRKYLTTGIDIRLEPVLVYPTLHYQNGGIEINVNGESVSVGNLFAVGEAAGGIHGKNRLMGNSLLDVIVFGCIAGRNAAMRSKNVSAEELTLEHIKIFNRERELAGIMNNDISPMLLPDYSNMYIKT